MQDYEIQNLLRTFDRLRRIKRNAIVIEDIELANGEMIDKETRSSIIDGTVEIIETTHNRRLGCGHIKTPSNIIAVCNACGRLVCEKCIFQCDRCHVFFCNNCSRVYAGKDGEKVLCTTCHFDATNKDKVGKVLGFFVKKKEGKT